MTARALGLAAVLAACSAHASGTFRWEVPGELARVSVPGTQVANGIPLRMEARRTKASLPELRAHFRAAFLAAGFYVPPARDIRPVTGNPIVTGVDPATRVVYTVIFQGNPDKTITCILGEGHPADARPVGSDLAPLFPGATEVTTATGEGSRSLVYLAPAAPGEVQAFYRETLRARGFEEREPGRFQSNDQAMVVTVSARNEKRSSVAVLVIDRAAGEEAR